MCAYDKINLQTEEKLVFRICNRQKREEENHFQTNIQNLRGKNRTSMHMLTWYYFCLLLSLRVLSNNNWTHQKPQMHLKMFQTTILRFLSVCIFPSRPFIMDSSVPGQAAVMVLRSHYCDTPDYGFILHIWKTIWHLTLLYREN